MSPSISGALAPGAGGGPGAASRFREASRRHDRGSGSYPADPGPSEEEPPQMAEPGHRGHGPRGLLRTGGGGEGAQLFRELRRQVTGKKGGWWRATATALLGAEAPEAARGRRLDRSRNQERRGRGCGGARPPPRAGPAARTRPWVSPQPKAPHGPENTQKAEEAQGGRSTRGWASHPVQHLRARQA